VYDVAIVGGGIIGLATARARVQRFPHRRLLLLEKESRLAAHQTGRNSGVIHSGIYYRPGSLKATLCVEGARRLTAFCEARGIPHQRVGKVIVAVADEELPRLEALYERGHSHGIPGLTRIGPERLRELEPYVYGLTALYLPQVAIVDFTVVAQAMARDITDAKGTILTAARVTRIQRNASAWWLQTTHGRQEARFLVNCGGLHADRIAYVAGDRTPVRIVPFRGEYYTVRPERRQRVNGLVYPVPDPALPFLGVHFTKMRSGGLHVGPTAILALKREGYARYDVSLRDCVDFVTHPGFWRMARRYWTVGVGEWLRSWNRQAFVRAAQRLVPSLRASDLIPSPAGVRAQAVGTDGSLLDDVGLRESNGALHVYNAPSPAATASLAIGETIVERISAWFN